VLLSLLVEDSNGVGRPVAFGVVIREDRTHVEQFLKFFSENNSMETTEVVVTDKVVAEMNAVKECWPNCRPLICHFHIMSSLSRFVRSCEFSVEDRKQCIEVGTLVNIVLPCRLLAVMVNGHFMKQSSELQLVRVFKFQLVPTAKAHVLILALNTWNDAVSCKFCAFWGHKSNI